MWFLKLYYILLKIIFHFLIGGMCMKLSVKDPGSALTHFIAMILAVLAAAPLLLKAAFFTDRLHVAALAVFIVSMILLYAASTVYHTFDISEGVNRLLRKIDHMMIFVLIAGTYTPVCLIVLGNSAGYRLLALVWAIAAVGILINALWISCPKWMDLCDSLWTDPVLPDSRRLRLAPGRRDHLHRRRRHLCIKAPAFQLQA